MTSRWLGERRALWAALAWHVAWACVLGWVLVWVLALAREVPGWAWTGTPAHYLPWRPAIWGPWVLLFGGLAVLGIARAGLDFAEVRRALAGQPRRAPSAAQVPAARPRATLLDWALVVGLALLGVPVLDAFVHTVNPHGLIAGGDAVTYLENAKAVMHGDWHGYNVDRRVFHAWVLAWWGSGQEDLVQASLDISRWSVLSLPALTYLMGRPIFGRRAAVVAGLLVVFNPHLWPFAARGTNYALFYALLNGALAALAWALTGQRLRAWAAYAALTAFAFLTMEKAFLTLVGTTGFGVLVTLRLGLRPALLRFGVAGVVAGGILWAYAPPVAHTPFGFLITNQRAELHFEMPYEWPAGSIIDPDLERPSPVSHLLPDSWRGGDLDFAITSLTTPAYSNSVVYGRLLYPATGPFGAAVRPKTSIPPLAHRLERNLESLKITFRSLHLTVPLLLVLGLLACVLPRPGRRGLHGRGAALALVLSLVAVWGSLTLKYHPRYVVHAFPVLALMLVAGVDWLAALIVQARRPIVLAGQALLTAGFSIAVGATLLTDSMDAWSKPSEDWLAATQEVPSDFDPRHPALASLEAARWVTGNVTEDVAIYDCAPIGIWYHMHRDRRFALRQDHRRCEELLQRPPAAGSLLVLSDHQEYAGGVRLRPWMIRARSETWEPIYRYEFHRGEIPAHRPATPASSGLWLFQRLAAE